jgi:hypothetical protein
LQSRRASALHYGNNDNNQIGNLFKRKELFITKQQPKRAGTAAVLTYLGAA